MKKPRKTNIHIESSVFRFIKPQYHKTGVTYLPDGNTTSLNIFSLSSNIYFRLYIGEVLHPVYTDTLPDYQDVPAGFHTSFFIRPGLGTSVKIEAYRFGEGKHLQDYEECFVGSCSGQFTDQGFVCEFKDNVTTQEKTIIETKRRK